MIKNSIEIEKELRAIILGFSGLAYIGAGAELVLIMHYESFIQVIPFVLSGFGLITIAWMWISPEKRVAQILRYTSVVIALGGLYGMYEHFINNLEFEMEIHPEYSFGTAFWEALGGATPFVAPGILLFAALLAMASTWKHPVFR